MCVWPAEPPAADRQLFSKPRVPGWAAAATWRRRNSSWTKTVSCGLRWRARRRPLSLRFVLPSVNLYDCPPHMPCLVPPTYLLTYLCILCIYFQMRVFVLLTLMSSKQNSAPSSFKSLGSVSVPVFVVLTSLSRIVHSITVTRSRWIYRIFFPRCCHGSQ